MVTHASDYGNTDAKRLEECAWFHKFLINTGMKRKSDLWKFNGAKRQLLRRFLLYTQGYKCYEKGTADSLQGSITNKAEAATKAQELYKLLKTKAE